MRFGGSLSTNLDKRINSRETCTKCGKVRLEEISFRVIDEGSDLVIELIPYSTSTAISAAYIRKRNAVSRSQTPRRRRYQKATRATCKARSISLERRNRQLVSKTIMQNSTANHFQGTTTDNMAKDNLTAILYGINDIRLEQTPIEEPDVNEVLIEMGCVGICGSDVHYLVNGKIGDFVVRKPMIIGHESSGVVAKLGRNVKNLKVGDRVAIEPGVPCRTCSFCKDGRYNLCKDIVFCATPPVHGSLRRYYKHAADFCYKLPDHITLEEGALLEPLSVGVHACKRADIGIDSKVLILGAGPIGLVTLLVAKAMGASKVVITDIVQDKLDVAKKLGADETYLFQKQNTEVENVKKIHELFGGEPDKTIDASGAQSCIRLAILVTKSGGVVVLVGMGAPEVQIPLISALVREVDIRGVFRYVNDYASALNLLASGKVNVKPLITHNYKLEDTVKAFEKTKSGQSGVIKVMIHCK